MHKSSMSDSLNDNNDAQYILVDSDNEKGKPERL